MIIYIIRKYDNLVDDCGRICCVVEDPEKAKKLQKFFSEGPDDELVTIEEWNTAESEVFLKCEKDLEEGKILFRGKYSKSIFVIRPMDKSTLFSNFSNPTFEMEINDNTYYWDLFAESLPQATNLFLEKLNEKGVQIP